MVGNGVRIDGRPCAPARSPPMLGEDTDDLLRELGYDDTAIAALRAVGAV